MNRYQQRIVQITEFVWNEVYCNLPAAAKQSAARRDMLLVQATEV